MIDPVRHAARVVNHRISNWCKMAQLYTILPRRTLMPTRAIRGATTAAENSERAILDAASELLRAILVANALAPEHMISILFTMTADLDAVYPTRAAREMGWTDVPLLDAQQPRVHGDLARCMRVLVHCETERARNEIKHIYLGEARRLRPDLVE